MADLSKLPDAKELVMMRKAGMARSVAACDALADALRGAHEAIVILKRERRPDSTAPNPVWLSAIEDEARALLARLGLGGDEDEISDEILQRSLITPEERDMQFSAEVAAAEGDLDRLQRAYDWWIGVNSPWTVKQRLDDLRNERAAHAQTKADLAEAVAQLQRVKEWHGLDGDGISDPVRADINAFLARVAEKGEGT